MEGLSAREAAPPDDRFPHDAEHFLTQVGRDLEPHLQHAIDRVPDVGALKEGVVFQVLSGGKRLRAALCLAVCEVFSGSYRPALGFAAAMEHLQNFTLVHDDIADGDVERRGRESAWRRFGLPHGINIGDAFVPLAALAIVESDVDPATKTRLVRVVGDHGLEVVEGQSLDIALRANDAPTEDAYVECTEKKTGAFFAMAIVGGAVIGGASEPQLELLGAFGREAGVAFQIRDDLLDVAGGKGRSAGSDVLEGKRTLMTAYALAHAGDEEGRRLVEILNRPRERTTAADVAWVHGVYARTGALQHADDAANRRLDAAVAHLDALPATPAKYRFLRLCRYLTRRSR